LGLIDKPQALDYRYLIIKPFILASLLLLLSLIGVFYFSYQFARLEKLTSQLDACRFEVLKLHNAVVRAETGHHGYLLTGNLHFLETYQLARNDIQSLDSSICNTLPQYQRLRKHFDILQELVGTKLRSIDHSIHVEMTSGAYAPHLNSSKMSIDVTNKIEQEFDVIEKEFLGYQQVYANDLRSALRLAEGGAVLLVLVIVGLFIGGYRRTIRLFEIASTSQITADKMSYSAYHDALTGLPNRRFFEDYLQRQILLSRRSAKPFSLMYMDLDGFKKINDELGHDAGDEALLYATKRFKDALRESDFVARLGGDEFIVLVHDYHIQAEVGGLANRIIRYLNQPFTINGKHQLLGVSIGISAYPVDGESSELLIKAADDAMYLAKKYGKNRAFFAHG
jgi:diguanylate cyclase (GGDEF)-like protein